MLPASFGGVICYSACISLECRSGLCAFEFIYCSSAVSFVTSDWYGRHTVCCYMVRMQIQSSGDSGADLPGYRKCVRRLVAHAAVSTSSVLFSISCTSAPQCMQAKACSCSDAHRQPVQTVVPPIKRHIAAHRSSAFLCARDDMTWPFMAGHDPVVAKLSRQFMVQLVHRITTPWGSSRPKQY